MSRALSQQRRLETLDFPFEDDAVAVCEWIKFELDERFRDDELVRQMGISGGLG